MRICLYEIIYIISKIKKNKLDNIYYKKRKNKIFNQFELLKKVNK